jgi:hypothetical protein
MSQHERWHWTHESIKPQPEAMTLTQIHPATRLSPIVAGIGTAVENTGETTAISIHVYGPDMTRIGCSARRYYYYND